MRGSAKSNYRYNSSLPEKPPEGEMINGQGMGAAARLRYGLCRMSFNGCESIAVHNALAYLGSPRPLGEIARFMERYRILWGVFGCRPSGIGKALESFGASCRFAREASEAESAAAFIVTYWTGRRFLSSVHTVFCARAKDGIEVFNRYNNRARSYVCKSLAEFAGKRPPIAIYLLETKETVTNGDK